MSRYLPTLRGWIAFLLALCASCFYPAILPPVYVESGVQRWSSEPVSPIVAIGGVILAIVCFAACVEAFRRGSRADKIAACIAVLLTIGLLVVLFRSFTLPVRPTPNTY
jgi:Na+/melibiose symporter-like transporter